MGPRRYPGGIDAKNMTMNAIDTHPTGLIAHASYIQVVIVHLHSASIIQVLDSSNGHQSCIDSVRFAPTWFQSQGLTYIVSKDIQGTVIVWNYATSEIIFQLFERTVVDAVEFHPRRPSLLLVCSCLNGISMFRLSAKGSTTRLWTLSYPNGIKSIKTVWFDPFDDNIFTFQTQTDWLYKVNNLSQDEASISTETIGIRELIDAELRLVVSSYSPPDLKDCWIFPYPHRPETVVILLRQYFLICDSSKRQIAVAVRNTTRSPFRKVLFPRSNQHILIVHANDTLTLVQLNLDVHNERPLWDSRALAPIEHEVDFFGLVLVDSTDESFSYMAGVDVQGTVKVYKWEWCSNEFMQIGLVEKISSEMQCAAVCGLHQRIAIGTLDGNIQVLDASSGAIDRFFSLGPYCVRGLRWIYNKETRQPRGVIAVVQASDPKNLLETWAEQLRWIDMRLGTVTPVLDMHAAIRICMVENRVFQKSQRRTSGFLASITGKKDKTSAADLIHGILVSESSEFIALSCREDMFILQWEKSTPAIYILPPITAFAWRDSVAAYDELLLAYDSKLLLWRYDVSDGASLTEMVSECNTRSISMLRFSQDLIALASDDGTIMTCNYNTDGNRLVAYQKIPMKHGIVQQIRIAPSKTSQHMIILHDNGLYYIWEPESGTMTSNSQATKSQVIDVAWITERLPISIHSTEGITLRDISLSFTSSPISHEIIEKLELTHLMGPTNARALWLKHNFSSFDEIVSFCLRYSSACGDLLAFEFFHLAQQLMPIYNQVIVDHVDQSKASLAEKWFLRCTMQSSSISRLHDIAFRWTLLGSPVKAAETLMNVIKSEDPSPSRTLRLLKCLLLARDTSDRERNSEITVAAAAEIASEADVVDGTQVLVASNLYREAFDLLQDAGHWYDAWILSENAPLNDLDRRDIFLRWGAHLLLQDKRNEALQVFLVTGDLVRVIQLLHQDDKHRSIPWAGFFSEMCFVLGLLGFTDDESKYRVFINIANNTEIQQLLQHTYEKTIAYVELPFIFAIVN